MGDNRLKMTDTEFVRRKLDMLGRRKKVIDDEISKYEIMRETNLRKKREHNRRVR